MDPNAPAQVMPEETKFVEVKANCFYVPHTLIGFFGFSVIIWVSLSFLWLPGSYIYGNHENSEEETLGLALMLSGYILSALIWLYLIKKFVPVYVSDEGKRLRKEEAAARARRREERKTELKL